MSTKIYLVGEAHAPKTNQWEHMTNDWSRVDGLKAAIGPSATHKVVTVTPQKRGTKR